MKITFDVPQSPSRLLGRAGVVTTLVVILAGCGASGGANTSAAGGGAGSTATTSRPVTPEPTVGSLTGGCSGKPTKTSKIGLLVPLTGSLSADANDMVDGARLAINQLNSAGGVCGRSARWKFTTVIGDTQNEVASDVSSAVKLLTSTSNLNAVLTGYASTSNFEIVDLARAQMPYILSGNAPQTAAIIKKDPSAYPTVWSRITGYSQYWTALPPLLNKFGQEGKLSLGSKTVYMITGDDPYDSQIGAGLKTTFGAAGWKVVGNESVPTGTVTNWQTTLGKIVSLKPTVVVLLDYTPTVEAAFQNQFMQNPTKSLVFMQYGPSQPQFEQLAKSNANGVLYNQIGAANPARPDTKAILKAFKSKYGRAGGYYSTIADNEAMIYAYCVKQVGDPTNRIGIGKCIGSLKIQTPAGVLAFDPKTHLALGGPKYESIQFYQIQHGKQELIYPSTGSASAVQTPPWMKK